MLGFREIRTSEKITDEEERKSNNFQNIVPEGSMTYEECTAFIKSEFEKIWAEAREKNN